MSTATKTHAGECATAYRVHAPDRGVDGPERPRTGPGVSVGKREKRKASQRTEKGRKKIAGVYLGVEHSAGSSANGSFSFSRWASWLPRYLS